MIWVGFPILLLIVATLVVTAGTGSAWAAKSGQRSPIDGVIIASAQVIAVSQLLGLAGCLTPLWLLISHCLVTGIIRCVLRKQTNPANAIPGRSSSSSDDPIITNRPMFSIPQTLSLIFDRLIVILPVIAGLTALIDAAPNAPGGTDVWTYHLAFPAEWCIWHDLRCTVQNIGDPGPPFYPQHSGLIAHLLMAPLHSDILARFHQVPVWIAGLFALAAGIIATGVSRRSAWTATALVGLMPLVASWVPLAFSDISLASAIALLFYAAARIDRASSWRHAVILGLTTGLAAGFKAYGLYYATPLVAWGLIRLLKHRSSGRIATLAAWLTGSALTGSFWYLRNWLLNDNPLFPYQAELGGRVIFPGLYSRAQVVQHGFHQFGFMQQFTLPELWKNLGAPGFLLVIGLFLSLAHMLWNRRFHATIMIPLIMGLQFLYLPYRHHPRLVLPALWLCGPAIAILFDALFRRCSGLSRGIITTVVLIILTGVTPYVVLSSWIVISLAFVIALVSDVLRRTPPVWTRRFLLLSLLGLTIVFPRIVREYETHKWIDHGSELGEIAAWLAELNDNRPHLQIAFTGFNTPYPLTGLFLGNTVRYLSRNGNSEASWTGDRPYTPMPEPDYDAWRQLVNDIGINVIVIATIPGDPLPPEYHWVRNMSDFELGYLTPRYQAWSRR